MILDKDSFSRAAAKRLDSDCARAGETIHEERILHQRTENIEQSFAQPVARRTHGQSLEGFQRAAAEFSSDYAHVGGLSDGRQLIALLPRRTELRGELTHFFSAGGILRDGEGFGACELE